MRKWWKNVIVLQSYPKIPCISIILLTECSKAIEQCTLQNSGKASEKQINDVWSIIWLSWLCVPGTQGASPDKVILLSCSPTISKIYGTGLRYWQFIERVPLSRIPWGTQGRTVNDKIVEEHGWRDGWLMWWSVLLVHLKCVWMKDFFYTNWRDHWFMWCTVLLVH